jgi:hypothetical protein
MSMAANAGERQAPNISETPYAGDQDWIFASDRMKSRQPLWPEAIERNYIRPAAKRANITKHRVDVFSDYYSQSTKYQDRILVGHKA